MGLVEVAVVGLLIVFVKHCWPQLASEEAMGVQVVLTHEMTWYAMAGEVGEDEGQQRVTGVQVAPIHEMPWYAIVGEVGEDEGQP